jgi:hypothetical protein
LERIDILRLLVTGTEVTACLTGFANWKKLRHSYWKYFPVYLAMIVSVELAGQYLISRGLLVANFTLYNYFGIPLEILFFIWLLRMEFAQTSLRKLPLVAGGIYLACWVADMLITPKGPYIWIGSFSYTVGIVVLLVLIMASLYKFATSNEIVFIKTNMMFWVCMGLFVFYAFSLPFYGMGNYLYHHHKSVYRVYFYAIYYLNYIMYALFTIAFIWGKPK